MRFGLILKLVISFTVLLAFLIGLFVFSNSYVLRRAANDIFIDKIKDVTLHIAIEAIHAYEDSEIHSIEEPAVFKLYKKEHPDLWFRIQYNDKTHPPVLLESVLMLPLSPKLMMIFLKHHMVGLMLTILLLHPTEKL